MRVVLTGDVPSQLERCRQLVQGLGLECGAGDCVTFSNLTYRLAKAPATDLVLVLAGAEDDRTQAAIRYAAAHAGSPVLAAGPATDGRAGPEAVRSGARQYLDHSRLKEELTGALDFLFQEGTVKGRRGQTFAVTAVAPGHGVTTTAAGLAFALGAGNPGQVLLAEVGNGIPELALDLDLDVRHPVGDVVRDWQRSDARLVREALVAHPAGVSVLAHAAETLSPVVMAPDVMRHLVVLSRTMFDEVVLDLGHGGYGAALEAMRLAEAVLVLVRLDAPGLRMARRYLRLLAEEGLDGGKVHVVASRYGQSGQLDWRKAEEALGSNVLEWLPEDPASVNLALNRGRPLVQAARRAKLTRAFDKLANHLAAKPAG
jgi:pilus assembly protein CpaE